MFDIENIPSATHNFSYHIFIDSEKFVLKHFCYMNTMHSYLPAFSGRFHSQNFPFLSQKYRNYEKFVSFLLNEDCEKYEYWVTETYCERQINKWEDRQINVNAELQSQVTTGKSMVNII